MELNQKITIDTSKPFGMKDKIGYAFGDLGNNFTLSFVNSFLLIFYTNIFGLSGASVGVLFLIARFIDAIADVTVGRLTDMSKLTDVGRFIPWVKRMKYPLLICAILLFVPFIKTFPTGVKLTYAFITYLAFGIFYSSVNIPYGSMASAISNDPNDKTTLSTFRSLGSAIGSGIVNYVVPMVMYVGTSTKISGDRVFMIATICAICGFLSYVVLTHLVTERVRSEKSEPIALPEIGKAMLKNKALIVLVIVDIVLVINQNLSGVTISYLFNDYFMNKTAMSIALVINFATIVILAPFAGFFTKHFGRKESAVGTLLFGSVMYFILMLLHTHSTTVFLIMLLLGSIGIGMFNLMVWAFITDVIDNQQVISGAREDGIVYGVNSFARKVAQAIAGGFGGIMLTVIGYVSSTSGGAQQTATVVNRIYMLATVIPAVCALLAAVILFFFYPLNKKRVQENSKILNERSLEQ